MRTKELAADAQTVEVAKQDIVEVWSLLERLVVSLDRIGSAHAIPGGRETQAPAQRRAMLEELDKLIDARELARARRVLVHYLSDDEAEEISERLAYWQSPKSKKH